MASEEKQKNYRTSTVKQADGVKSLKAEIRTKIKFYVG